MSFSGRQSRSRVFVSCLVIFIIMVVIGIPGINQARSRLQRENCHVLIHRVEAAKIAYQIDRELDKDKLNKGQPITLEQLVESGRVIKAPPVFPVEGRLVIGGAGEPVTFSSPHFKEVLSTVAPSSS